MTGMLPHNHGMIQNVEDGITPVHELPDSPYLLSRRLEKAGYQLGYSGKWHLGSSETKKFNAPIHPCLPKDVGFTGQNFPGHGDGGWRYPEFREYLKQRGLKHKVELWPEKTIAFRPDLEGCAGLLEQPIEGTVPYFLAENTINLINDFADNDEDKPFFIWHNFWGPHSPYYITREYLEKYREVEIPEWGNYRWPAKEIEGPHLFSITPQLLWHNKQLSWEDWAWAIRYYYAFTTMIDDQIGRIFEHLRQRGLWDNTVIIFAADHGESLGDHGGIYNKGWTHFEETHRIPLIVRMPGAASRKAVCEKLVSIIDIYPTILDLAGEWREAGGSYPAHTINWPYDVCHYPEGRTLLPLINGEDPEWRDMIVSEFHGLYENPCIMRTFRYGHYKYGYNFMGQDELYDLSQDPYEMNNVIKDPAYAEIVEDLHLRIWNHMRESHDWAIGGFHTVRLAGRGDLPGL
jgi:arylsulfatase A-like enzyme